MRFLALGLKCGPAGEKPTAPFSAAAKRFSLSNEARANAPIPVPHCWKNLRRVRSVKCSSWFAFIRDGKRMRNRAWRKKSEGPNAEIRKKPESQNPNSWFPPDGAED